MRRILFVDDEQNVLDGLRRMLRPKRRVWEMTFAESGEAALARLDEQRFDVVVTDMRMPDMDGAELLRTFLERSPSTARIVLSGHADRETMVESARVAHRHLAKPCEADDLVQAIAHACTLRDMLSNERLLEIVSGIDALPSLPTFYSEVMEEVRAEEPSLARVSAIVSRDPAMTAKILQVVNSAFFGLPRHVSTPSHAVSLLGLDIVSSLVLMITVFAEFPDVPGIDLEALWRHSSDAGALARRIATAETKDAGTTDQALVGGMLHEAGRLVLASRLPTEYARVVAAAGDRVSIWEAEYEVFGCSHMEVGGYLLGLWGLPGPIVSAVAHHHLPTRAGDRGFTPLTALHAAVGLLESTGPSGDPSAPGTLDMDYLAGLGVADRVEAWSKILEAAE